LVFAVEGGGVIPASIVSQSNGIPIMYCKASHKDGGGGGKYGFDMARKALVSIPTGTKVLIVDDVADTGKTLIELVKICKYLNLPVQTLVVAKFTRSEFTPDHVLYEFDGTSYLYMPWEHRNEHAK
jgi:hypoxanthine phosphoribosyltransferase